MKETLKRKLHKLFFPKEDFAIQKMLDFSVVMFEKSPHPEVRRMGEEFYMTLIRILK